jgi:hypothetical protein
MDISPSQVVPRTGSGLEDMSESLEVEQQVAEISAHLSINAHESFGDESSVAIGDSSSGSVTPTLMDHPRTGRPRKRTSRKPEASLMVNEGLPLWTSTPIGPRSPVDAQHAFTVTEGITTREVRRLIDDSNRAMRATMESMADYNMKMMAQFQANMERMMTHQPRLCDLRALLCMLQLWYKSNDDQWLI